LAERNLLLEENMWWWWILWIWS